MDANAASEERKAETSRTSGVGGQQERKAGEGVPLVDAIKRKLTSPGLLADARPQTTSLDTAMRFLDMAVLAASASVRNYDAGPAA